MSPPLRTTTVALALGLAGAGAIGCGHQPEFHDAAPPAALRHVLQVAGHSVSVELAVDRRQRDLGLMHRTHVDADAGMLFVFEDDQPRSFWMKNTLIPLDIVFLDADGTVQNISRGEPLVEVPTVNSLRPARMVLELNAGWCEEHGLQPGQRIEIPPGILELGQA
jgi:uncharacterized membrane protein (UPF0127 family)